MKYIKVILAIPLAFIFCIGFLFVMPFSVAMFCYDYNRWPWEAL